jgi:CRISPR-associated protein (TIGR03986 family)
LSAAVILSWDPAARFLEFVPVNGGAGGPAEEVTVSAEDAADITARLSGLTLPKVAELESADGIVLIDEVAPADVVRCAVSAVGRPGARKFRFRNTERMVEIPDLPIAVLGVPDPAQAAAVTGLEYLYTEQFDPPGCWLNCAGGIGPWLAARHPAATPKQQAAEQRKLRKQDEGRRAQVGLRFVNPYTFVPFPSAVERAAPGGHQRLAPGCLSGAFTVTWTFTTPFQASEGVSGTAVLRLSGASVKGAVRTVHETLAGGCLRVFDADFIPSYRDHAQTKGPEWTLAVVESATEGGQPLSVALCDEVVWAGVGQLRAACGQSLSTGSRVAIRDDDIPEVLRLGRKELDPAAVVGKDGNWVVLVTDSGTRRKEITDRKTGSERPGAYLLACGRLSDRTAEVTEAAWHAFQIAVAGARDLQPSVRQRAVRGPDDDSPAARRPTAPVTLGRPIGNRRVVTGQLWAGDVAWARTSTDSAGVVVDQLSLAALWRHPGWDDAQQPDLRPEDWSAGRRVPPALLACRDPGDLCPSCRVFGSVDQQSRDARDQARQRAYAGHVRFGDARSEQPVKLSEIDRAPLGVPRSGAGQFYLDYDKAGARPAEEGRKPTREWGSDPDSGRRRRLRGRKFYWHADPTGQPVQRHLAREHQRPRADGGGELISRRWLAPPGTVLCQRVTFDNLSRAELGGLLAAFEPHRVLPAAQGGPPLLHLGGGKPLGLGSCTAAVDDLRVWSAASRYGGAPAETPDEDAYLNEFADACPAEIIDEVWPPLAAVLASGTVDPAQVWYPPGRYWADQEDHAKAFDEPFAFFTFSSGMHLEKKGERRLIRLPDPAAGDQSLRIITKEDLK